MDESTQNEMEAYDDQRLGKQKMMYTRQITYICAWCRQEKTEQRYPSPAPRYCSPICKREATRAKTRERVANWRKSHAKA